MGAANRKFYSLLYMEENKNISYAEAIAELERIVARLQDNSCEIDELKELTTRAMTLLKYCKEKLFETDESLKKLLDEWNDDKQA